MDIARVHTLVDNTHDAVTAVDAERAVVIKGLADCHRLAIAASNMSNGSSASSPTKNFEQSKPPMLDHRHGFV